MSRNHYYDGAYFGGKGSCFREMINLIPPHIRYWEPFVGKGAVLRNKRPANQNIGIDIDPAVIASFPDVGHTVANSFGLAETVNAPGAVFPAHVVELAETCEAGPAEVMLYCADALDWLDDHRHDITPDTMIYLDPGYLMSTRKRQRDSYRFEFATEKQHGALLDLIKPLNCMVMISGYWSQLYSQELNGWNTHSFQAVTRGGTLAEEWLWYNYDPPTELHDYRWVGEDFRVREKYKRRRQTVLGKLERMDEQERKAAILEINSAFAGNVVQPLCKCGCGRPPEWKGNGRPPQYFSDACKQKAYRQRQKALRNPLRNSGGKSASSVKQPAQIGMF